MNKIMFSIVVLMFITNAAYASKLECLETSTKNSQKFKVTADVTSFQAMELANVDVMLVGAYDFFRVKQEKTQAKKPNVPEITKKYAHMTSFSVSGEKPAMGGWVQCFYDIHVPKEWKFIADKNGFTFEGAITMFCVSNDAGVWKADEKLSCTLK